MRQMNIIAIRPTVALKKNAAATSACAFAWINGRHLPVMHTLDALF
jgi:hypothetical protein